MIDDTKTGAAWLEAARMHLNPLSTNFDLRETEKCLEYAARQAPDNFDIYIEMGRLSTYSCKKLPSSKQGIL